VLRHPELEYPLAAARPRTVHRVDPLLVVGRGRSDAHKRSRALADGSGADLAGVVAAHLCSRAPRTAAIRALDLMAARRTVPFETHEGLRRVVELTDAPFAERVAETWKASFHLNSW
jgi:hypothetical protein